MIYRVFTDGAARGNPGHAGIGVVIRTGQGEPVAAWGEYVGRCTNNVAEYTALVAALERLLPLNPERALFHLDSELVVRQLDGRYRVRDEKMKELHEKVRRLLRGVPAYEFRHVARELNSEADRLANRAIDEALAGRAV